MATKSVEKKSSSKSSLDKVREKMNAMKNKKGGGNYLFNFLTVAADTKVVIRVFPWKKDHSEFYLERAEYKFDDKSSVAFDGKGTNPIDAILAERRKKGLDLQKKNKDKGQAYLKKEVDPIKPRDRYYMNAAVLTKEGPVQTGKHAGEPMEKAELWAVGPQIMEQILGLMVEEDADVCGDFLDPKTAYDFVVKRVGEKFLTKYTVTATRKYVSVDTSEVETHDIAAVVPPAISGKALLALFNGETPEADEADEDEDDDIDDSKVGSSKKKAKKDDDDEEEDEDDADDEEVDEDEDDSDDEDSDDEEEADEDEEEDHDVGEKPSKKKAKKAVDEDDEEEADEDDESDDDEEADEDEDDDEEERPAKKKAKKAVDEDEVDDEEEADEDDEEADEDDDEDSDDEEEADEDDEEEKPAKKKAKAAPKKGASPKASPKKKK